jgi:hypothetical protein
MHRSRKKTSFRKEKKILKNIGTELIIGTDGDENLFINFKWHKLVRYQVKGLRSVPCPSQQEAPSCLCDFFQLIVRVCIPSITTRNKSISTSSIVAVYHEIKNLFKNA